MEQLIINQLLDAERRDRGCANDAQLANALGTHQMAITRLRRGEISPSARLLVRLLHEQRERNHDTAILTPA